MQCTPSKSHWLIPGCLTVLILSAGAQAEPRPVHATYQVDQVDDRWPGLTLTTQAAEDLTATCTRRNGTVGGPIFFTFETAGSVQFIHFYQVCNA